MRLYSVDISVGGVVQCSLLSMFFRVEDVTPDVVAQRYRGRLKICLVKGGALTHS
jgi:hypothetical protein